MTEVGPGGVIVLEWVLVADGVVVDRSPDGEPVAVLYGHAHGLPPGLEGALAGRRAGPFRIELPPEEGAGVHDPEKVVVADRDEFPEGAELREGESFHAVTEDGRPVSYRVVALEEDRVTLDANPELAGKALLYEGVIHSVREATREEMEHGHAHGEGGVAH
jgi:FKBP-type peptidyl-prolyl cis-trans isomerase SlyD